MRFAALAVALLCLCWLVLSKRTKNEHHRHKRGTGCCIDLGRSLLYRCYARQGAAKRYAELRICFVDWLLTMLARDCARGNFSSPALRHLSLSAQYMLDCCEGSEGKRLPGCGGGHLDEAWDFLQTTGLPETSADPYARCSDESSDCSEPRVCPRAFARLFRADQVYAVSAPGDVEVLCRASLCGACVVVLM